MACRSFCVPCFLRFLKPPGLVLIRRFGPVGQRNRGGGEGIGGFFGSDERRAVLGDQRLRRGQETVHYQTGESLALSRAGSRREVGWGGEGLGVKRLAPGLDVLDKAV